MSFVNRAPQLERVSKQPHPDFQFVETRVSEFLRLYGSGKIQNLPEDPRPEVQDNRSTDEMLADPFQPTMATEEVEILAMFQEKAEDFEKAMQDAILTHKDQERAEELLNILKNSTDFEEKQSAYDELEEIKSRSRARQSK